MNHAHINVGIRIPLLENRIRKTQKVHDTRDPRASRAHFKPRNNMDSFTEYTAQVCTCCIPMISIT